MAALNVKEEAELTRLLHDKELVVIAPTTDKFELISLNAKNGSSSRRKISPSLRDILKLARGANRIVHN